jgi:Gram-negative bacterial TonB protein C-terminal
MKKKICGVALLAPFSAFSAPAETPSNAWECTTRSQLEVVRYFADGTFVRSADFQGGRIFIAGEFTRQGDLLTENQRLNRFESWPSIGTTDWIPAVKGITWARSNHKIKVASVTFSSTRMNVTPIRVFNWDRSDVNEQHGKAGWPPYQCSSASDSVNRFLSQVRRYIPTLLPYLPNISELPRTPTTPSSVRRELNSPQVACQNLIQPAMPLKAENEGISGSVTAQVTISNTKIVKIEILKSEPEGIFDDAVRDAIMQYRCQVNNGGEGKMRQEFQFTMK